MPAARTKAELQKLTVKQLKELCKQNGHTQIGKKVELISKLLPPKTEVDLQKLTVVKLKELCKTSGLSQTGNKKELIAKLLKKESTKDIEAMSIESTEESQEGQLGEDAPLLPPTGNLTVNQVNNALRKLGIDPGDKIFSNVSCCTKKAIQKRYITLEGGLE